MFDTGCRPMGRLSCLLVVMSCLLGAPVAGAAAVPQGGPATTTVADTVFMADGTPAQGNLIILWPAFLTSSGAAVAAGETTTALGTGGALSVALVPNAGATPAGSYYTVVYQIGPGEVKTEYWVVPTASPANLAAVRTTPGVGIAGQPVSLQFVNSELATKANDNAVVHLSGNETITGAKTFSAAPNVPTPTGSGQVANKAYVDASVSTVGSGTFLATAGGTMTGPITLPGGPAAPLQAATKQYVDTGLAAKSDLISGLVPTGELGTGLATSGTCLLGNGTWGTCGGGSGTGNLSTNPTANQAIAQPAGTSFSTNNLANIRYVTSSWNWAESPADNLSTPGSQTIHLSPCPLGLDTASGSNFYTYKVYIAGTGTPEAVAVTGGTCVPGTSSGTITVTTAFAHAAHYTVGSASSGIQEAWNDAWTNDSGVGVGAQTSPYVKLAAGQQYNVFASVYLRGRGGVLDGAGALMVCSTRDRCIYVGTTAAMPFANHHKLYNLSGTSTVNVDGVQVSSAAATSGTYSITTASAHPFVTGDTVDCEYHSQASDAHWSSPVTSVPNSTSFTVSFGTNTFSPGTNTFGFCNLLNAFIEDNSDHVAVQDINIFQSNPAGLGYFTYGIVNDNDQQFIVERAANRSSVVLNTTTNWPIGAFVYERNDQGNNGITYLHNTEITGVNCVTGGGNGIVVSDSVCQGFPTYGIRYAGGLQPATLQNIYQESTGGSANPLYGIAAQMGIAVQGGSGTKLLGTFPASGFTPVFVAGGGTAAERSYFVVPRSSVWGYGPVLFMGSAEPVNGSVSIPLAWPSVDLQTGASQSVGTLTWDILVTTGIAGTAPNGTGNFALATNVSGSCGTNGKCSYTDTQGALGSYTVQQQTFEPIFWFWPANLAINNDAVILADEMGTNPGAVASQGTKEVSIVAEQCKSSTSGWRRTPIWISCMAVENTGGAGSMGTVLQEQDPANNGPLTNSKGRLNFGKPIGNVPNDLVTLQDSNFSKTMAASGERPLNDAGDMALGLDQSGGLTERAPTSISSYINSLPSGSNYQERLTAAAKTFNVPLTVNGNLTVTSGTVTLPFTGTGSQCLHVSSAGVLSGTGVDCGSGGGTSGTVTGGVMSQVALYPSNGTTVSGDSALTDNGTTLNYAGSGGIAASTGAFSGNLTVNGQLLVAGPWMVSSPIPGTAMPAAATGTSALGISNDGNFYISANAGTPQKVATSATSSFFTNLVQEDANTLGEVNGTNAEALHVYKTYSDASDYERTGLSWDATDGYFVLKNENAGTGSQRGIGFWIGSSIRWGIDTTSTLKPFANNLINLGSATLAPQTVYAATSFDTLTQGRQNFELCNDSTMGTALNFLTVYNASACAVKAAATNTDGVIGIVSNGSGTTGNAVITYRGYVPCSFDGSTTAGDFVVASTTNAGDCHDAGATRPSSVQVLGRVESTNTGVGTYGLRAALDAPSGSSAGLPDPGSNGIVIRNGTGSTIVRNLAAGSSNVTITNQSGVGGNPTVDVNTTSLFGSPALTGTPTTPTAAAGTNTTQVASTAFARGVVPPDSSTSVWITVPHASSAGTVFSSSANKAAFFGIMLGFQKTTSQVSYWVNTADTTSTTYDLGIYSGTSGGTCTLQAHTGSIAGSTAMTSGAHSVNWTGGSVTLQPGRYYLALTASATTSTAVIFGDSAGVTFAGGTGASSVGNVSVTSGGTLPATATCPTDSVQVAALIPAWLVN